MNSNSNRDVAPIVVAAFAVMFGEAYEQTGLIDALDLGASFGTSLGWTSLAGFAGVHISETEIDIEGTSFVAVRGGKAMQVWN